MVLHGFTLFLHRRRIWRSSTFWSRSWTKARKALFDVWSFRFHLVGPWPGGDGGLKPDVGASCECADSERASELGVSLHLTLRRVEVAKCCTRFTRFKDIQSNQNLDASLPRSYTWKEGHSDTAVCLMEPHHFSSILCKTCAIGEPVLVWLCLVGALEPWIFMTFPSYWECHHPNWRTLSFFRGVGQPPTRDI